MIAEQTAPVSAVQKSLAPPQFCCAILWRDPGSRVSSPAIAARLAGGFSALTRTRGNDPASTLGGADFLSAVWNADRVTRKMLVRERTQGRVRSARPGTSDDYGAG